MKTEERPDRTIMKMTALRWSAGKFFEMFAGDQSSMRMDAMRRMGMVSRLL